jgi:hypothetical protein
MKILTAIGGAILCGALSAPTAFARPASAAAPVDSPAMAARVKAEFLHAWTNYKRYAWGHDELLPLSRRPHDWYGQSLLMTPVDALDTLVLMGLKKEADADREQARLRQGRLRQEFRDHHPPARRAAVRLPTDRR